MTLVQDVTDRTVSRRTILAGQRGSRRGLMIGWWLPAGMLPADAAAGDQPFAPNAFIRIDRAGKVTVISPMIEMGQGTFTSLPMLVAEELDVDMTNVAVEHSPPTTKLYGNPPVRRADDRRLERSIRASTCRCAKLALPRARC